MRVLPVTLMEVDIYCCGGDHEAVIGERWRCPAIFGAMSWEEATVDEPGWTVVERGLVRARGRLRRPAGSDAHPLMDLGGCTVGFSQQTDADAVIAEGTISGSWHVAWDGAQEDSGYPDITVEGIVRRIRGYEMIRTPDPDDPGFKGWPTDRYELVDGDSMWMGSDVIIDLEVGEPA